MGPVASPFQAILHPRRRSRIDLYRRSSQERLSVFPHTATGPPGLEPGLTEPKSAVLPITPWAKQVRGAAGECSRSAEARPPVHCRPAQGGASGRHTDHVAVRLGASCQGGGTRRRPRQRLPAVPSRRGRAGWSETIHQPRWEGPCRAGRPKGAVPSRTAPKRASVAPTGSRGSRRTGCPGAAQAGKNALGFQGKCRAPATQYSALSHYPLSITTQSSAQSSTGPTESR